MSQEDNFELDIQSETENFAVWRSQEDEGYIYHIELGSITLHLAADEWVEFVELIQSVD